MTFIEELFIGVLLLGIAFLLNRLLESYKNSKELENQIAQSKIDLENQMAKITDEKRLEFLGRQLSEFYWPLCIRLEKDRCIWNLILGINSEENSVNQKFAVAIEEQVIIPNHIAMIALIETHIHLAQPDDPLKKKLMTYVRQATEYQVFRNAGTDKINPGWLHQDLYSEIDKITDGLQSQYNALIRLSAEREN